MKTRKLLLALLGLTLLGTGVRGIPAQQSSYQQRAEEWNSFQDIQRAQDPTERLQLIDNFMKRYPESEYRPFIYPLYVQTAFAVQNHAKTMDVVDAFLALDRGTVLKAYQQSNADLEDAALDPMYYRFYVLYTFSFLQSFRENLPRADAIAAKAAERARKGLKMHEGLYAAAQPPQGVTPEQFTQIKKQEENSFQNALAFTAWRQKNYAAAARAYLALVNSTPRDAAFNYRLGQALLRKRPPDYPHGFWQVARAIALDIPKKSDVKDYLTKAVAGYQQVLPECIERDIDRLIARSEESVHPPAGWSLVTAEQVGALRQEMNMKRILDDLKGGGETAHLMWLASCGSEIGAGEEGTPELPVLVLEVSESADNLVTLRAAAGEEAAEAKEANLEVKVVEPEAAKKLKPDDIVRIAGKISGYQNEPEFLLKLSEAKVNPEDIPETRE